MSPLVARSRDDLDAALKDVRAEQGRVALVPTMGALHAGHAALLREGRSHGEALVASIFVNPTQFGPNEDFARYPRSFDDDLDLCARERVDVVFAPDVDEVYPDGDPAVMVDPGPLGGVLEGAVRPTHFRGVLTVVAKLFGMVRPDIAVFGQKDYQQLVLIERMVRDLAMGVTVLGAATVREADGLALSSRNRYLTPEQRQSALALSRALRAGAADASRGGAAVLAAAHTVLDRAAGLDVDYLALRSPDLGAAPEVGPARLLVAARVGSTRLIDNLPLTLAAGRRDTEG